MGGTDTTDAIVHGGGTIHFTGIQVGTIPGGVGTTTTIPFITRVSITDGIPTTADTTITTTTPHARNTVVLQQAIAVTDPAQSVAHVRL